MQLLVEHEIDYIYYNSDLQRPKFVVNQIKRFHGDKHLYDYLVCSINELRGEKMAVGVMSSPTIKSMHWEDDGNQRIYDEGESVLITRKAFALDNN